jgi:hypothetical protein
MNAQHVRSTSLEGKFRISNCTCASPTRERSDVLFRHCKGHAQNALNRMKSNELPNHQGQQFEDKDSPRPSTLRDGIGPNIAGTPQIREQSTMSPMSRRRESQAPHTESQFSHLSPPSHSRPSMMRPYPASPGEDRIEALINAAQHLEPSAHNTPWRSPSPMMMARAEHGSHSVGRQPPDNPMGPPIDPAIDSGVLAFSPTGHVSSLDQWAFELVQSNNPLANRTPADALQTWLFPLEGDIQTPHHMTVDGYFDHEAFRTLPDNQASPSGSSVSIASRVPRERFQRVQSCWPSRNRRSSRLMPDLWQSLISCDCTNILSEVPYGVTETPLSERERKNSRWGLDEECRGLLQSALNNAPARSESYGDTASSSGDAAASPSVEGIQFPPAEILDIALEMYLYYFHPTLPIIHIPTFSAKNAPRPLLLCMCLIGLSILGTAGAAKFVSKTFPAVLQLTLIDLQALPSSNQPPHRHMCVVATSLMALNLASITGVRHSIQVIARANQRQRKSRIAQAEKLYTELVTVCLVNLIQGSC